MKLTADQYYYVYTAKNEQLVPSWWKQYWTIFCCPHCSGLLTTLNNIVKSESGVTILFNTVYSLEQCGQQNIVQYCFHQLGTSCSSGSFYAVYFCTLEDPAMSFLSSLPLLYSSEFVSIREPLVPSTDNASFQAKNIRVGSPDIFMSMSYAQNKRMPQ